MAGFLLRRRATPIGLDIGTRSVKLVQLSADHQRLIDAVRWDATGGEGTAQEAPSAADAAGDRSPVSDALVAALREARLGRKFRGRDAVLCLDARDLLVQNIRVPKAASAPLDRLVQQEAARRVSYPIAETLIRFLDVADVRQGEVVMREVILLACHRPVLERKLEAVARAGLRPAGVDAQPLALLRCYAQQLRRDEDRRQRAIYVHIGATNTAVVIAQGADVLFIKYLDVGGRHLDDAVARRLQLPPADAAALRRHNDDRRSDQQDPEVARSLAESIRPVVDQLASELSLCIRYHSVTFRGQPLTRLVLGGGEASSGLVEALAARLDLSCELGDPLRLLEATFPKTRRGQWDVATGLALWELN